MTGYIENIIILEQKKIYEITMISKTQTGMPA